MCLFSKKSVHYLLTIRTRNYYYRGRFLTTAVDPPKSFKEIPGPLSLPLVGTLYLYFPFIGRYQFDRLHKNALKNFQLYGPIIREEIVPGEHIVWLGDPDDIAKMFHTEGTYPYRKSHLTLEKYRLDRPHIYNSGGLLPTNGPEWSRIRKVFQKGLSGPTEALSFIKGSDDVISEWLDTRFKKIHKETSNMDFLQELSRLFLELIGVAAFDIRFQSFHDDELDPCSKSTKLLESAFVTNSTILKTDNGPQLWRKFETPAYRRLRKAQELMESVAIDLVALKLSTFKEKTSNPPTLLERYLASASLDFKDIIGVVCDFLLAGMDTTTYSSSFLLYHLATNPSTQDALYEEACRLLPNPAAPLTTEKYKQAEYAKCAVKESLRLRPISIGVGRQLTTDVVFSGYKVPSGTVVVTLNQVLSRMEKYFPEPDSFKPERWMKNDPSYVQTHPYLVIPFGHGQRSCIARRFAEQNMVILILKLARKYKLRWNGSEIDSKSLLINKPDGPILLSFEPR
ncbi:cytochrome P450 302a1, mitochondrial [Tribolium castaneum]|uniref:Cytochrome P450 302A1 n=1 Tax=Tribolium castaneum TaxID=7070 RepID=D6WNV9_TRICA|nr:PREDICTED: cytochrome P450 302a1, mitochondrial [Tribolium castaneum]EFA04695.1 cytochrome P450 302A1 [Tribolium castaneum]|eukprot:XP_974252.1 PREDICTED: cytochrome P450 302a1, mitochondrial [Tribolium castaneum]